MGKNSNSARIPSLDGLRGVAAFAVLISHIMLTFPVFATAVYQTNMTIAPGTWDWWITYTPLHLLWAGHEAVYVFFVLSGFVLTLPVLGRDSYPWREYFPKRLVRLYAPIIVAVALGVAMVFLVPRTNPAGLGEWLADRPAQATAWGTFKDITLVAGPSRLISPLWSLQWEILFSLLLPAYILFAVKQRKHVGLKVAAILLVIAAGAVTGQQALIYLPMFAAGSLMAEHKHSIGRWASSLGAPEWAAMFGAASILATVRWTLPIVAPGDKMADLATVPAFVGCAALVVIAANCPAAKRLLEAKPVQWLGLISFSLYLTHEPIVIALAFFFGPGGSWFVALIAIPVALAVGWAFYLVIEAPSHRLSQRVGRMFRAKQSVNA
jgi:peptidoglycan/LPS O-acetylase OafA/YrhL